MALIVAISARTYLIATEVSTTGIVALSQQVPRPLRPHPADDRHRIRRLGLLPRSCVFLLMLAGDECFDLGIAHLRRIAMFCVFTLFSHQSVLNAFFLIRRCGMRYAASVREPASQYTGSWCCLLTG